MKFVGKQVFTLKFFDNTCKVRISGRLEKLEKIYTDDLEAMIDMQLQEQTEMKVKELEDYRKEAEYFFTI